MSSWTSTSFVYYTEISKTETQILNTDFFFLVCHTHMHVKWIANWIYMLILTSFTVLSKTVTTFKTHVAVRLANVGSPGVQKHEKPIRLHGQPEEGKRYQQWVECLTLRLSSHWNTTLGATLLESSFFSLCMTGSMWLLLGGSPGLGNARGKHCYYWLS